MEMQLSLGLKVLGKSPILFSFVLHFEKFVQYSLF